MSIWKKKPAPDPEQIELTFRVDPNSLSDNDIVGCVISLKDAMLETDKEKYQAYRNGIENTLQIFLLTRKGKPDRQRIDRILRRFDDFNAEPRKMQKALIDARKRGIDGVMIN